jgi:hypothetical protein
MKQSSVILHPRPFSRQYVYREWIVCFVALTSPIGAIESSQAIQKVFQYPCLGQNRATRGATILLRWPGRNTSGSRSDKRSRVYHPLRQRVWHRTGAGSWDLLFLRNPEAVASGPPHVTRLFSCRGVSDSFFIAWTWVNNQNALVPFGTKGHTLFLLQRSK